ncbi:MAG: asparagine synthase (glutamine-hydrolyzing) [Sedimentisphaerales bacterium]|nr:asparagine synthase (glutamine-hydrolyzing) [Sedimentisphaerales bacterium]
MCGIAGIYHLNNKITISKEILLRMIGMIKHRGPDQHGIYLDDNVGLAGARLSIIDLVSGAQPVHNEDNSLWIVYNGEIFNYPQLRIELMQKGHNFYTESDTEVMLHLYEEYGKDCLNLINGQFAFAIWDVKKKELFLARDRFGIRPLYYTIADNTLIFASEIKAIFINRQVSREIDPIAMEQIFTFWTTLSPGTAFKNIYELPPGYYMKTSRGKIDLKKYWDIPFYPRSEQFDTEPAEISEQIRELMLDAVRIRLRSDVPVGCYLSGGLDSSAVASLVVKNYNREVKTFGIRFEQKNFDEGQYQNQMVSWLKTDHSEINTTNDKIGKFLPDCLWHCEKPVLRTAPVPLFLLSELVNQNGLKVVLTGEGADEVFGGYDIFKESKIRRFCARYPCSQKRAGLFSRLYPYISDNPRLGYSLQSFFARGLDQVEDPVFSHLIRWVNTSRIRTFFSQELHHAIGNYNAFEQVRENLPPDYKKWDSLAIAQYLEMTIFLSNYLLSSQGDRVAMAHSVEIRLPFLDPRVIEFMAHVPAKWKILGINEKHILKKTFENILPLEIAHRPKHPYRAPIKQSLLNNRTIDFTREMLSESSLKKSGLFDSNKVLKLLYKLNSTDISNEVDNMALVGILSSQLIYQKFVESFSARSDYLTFKNLVVIDNRKKALQYT